MVSSIGRQFAHLVVDALDRRRDLRRMGSGSLMIASLAMALK
jgi:hypothetical protein